MTAAQTDLAQTYRDLAAPCRAMAEQASVTERHACFQKRGRACSRRDKVDG